jgi:hypothetical protein
MESVIFAFIAVAVLVVIGNAALNDVSRFESAQSRLADSEAQRWDKVVAEFSARIERGS